MNVIALSDEALRRKAPSIFATAPIEAVSPRYGFVPTIEVVESLRERGWGPVHAAQTRVRELSRRVYARHVIRFRRLDTPLVVGDCIPELVLTNSHDRSAAYALDVGLHRVLCANGMIAAIGHLGGAFRVRHGCQVVREVLAGSEALIEHFPSIAASLDRFTHARLTAARREAFAAAALEIRYGTIERSPVRPVQLLAARRAEDAGEDLWTTYNVVQENLMKGGLEGRSAGTGRRVRTRTLRSVKEDIRLNRALWMLAERFAEPSFTA